jgi:hypothetical protein
MTEILSVQPLPHWIPGVLSHCAKQQECEVEYPATSGPGDWSFTHVAFVCLYFILVIPTNIVYHAVSVW